MDNFTGKCHCGENTFTMNTEPEFQFVCYCNNCRVLNGGGHLCGMVSDETKLKKATNTQSYTYTGGSGSAIIMHFCPKCATHLYAFPTEHKGKVVIRVNTLVNSEFHPQHSLFVESAFPWDKTTTDHEK